MINSFSKLSQLIKNPKFKVLGSNIYPVFANTTHVKQNTVKASAQFFSSSSDNQNETDQVVDKSKDLNALNKKMKMQRIVTNKSQQIFQSQEPKRSKKSAANTSTHSMGKMIKVIGRAKLSRTEKTFIQSMQNLKKDVRRATRINSNAAAGNFEFESKLDELIDCLKSSKHEMISGDFQAKLFSLIESLQYAISSLQSENQEDLGKMSQANREKITELMQMMEAKFTLLIEMANRSFSQTVESTGVRIFNILSSLAALAGIAGLYFTYAGWHSNEEDKRAKQEKQQAKIMKEAQTLIADHLSNVDKVNLLNDKKDAFNQELAEHDNRKMNAELQYRTTWNPLKRHTLSIIISDLDTQISDLNRAIKIVDAELQPTIRILNAHIKDVEKREMQEVKAEEVSQMEQALRDVEIDKLSKQEQQTNPFTM